ncbi:methyltransferase domain-containing protein [Candidatus Binatia bacterium]|nr:methyltransferase domain-containing protein [Candidatus Binatia bacterium]
MPQDVWNPAQYARFAHERRQPFDDLAALVERVAAPRVVDLGCGTGELTAELHATLGARETLGVERSANMLARSAALARPGLRFVQGDIADFADTAAWDVVFSNAALQWLPEHERLLPRVAAAVAPGGQLAIQVPANFDHPTHVIAAELANDPAFATRFTAPPRTAGVLAPERYAELLDDLGFVRQSVRLQVYGHRLASRDDVVEWVRGTLLTAYESTLPPPLFVEFVERYRERLLPALRDTRPYFYPFKRILLWARRDAA